MNFQFRGIQASFFIHAAIFAAFFFLSGPAMKESKPIVIDFTVGSAPGSPAMEKNLESKRKIKPKQKSTNLLERARTNKPRQKDINVLPRKKEMVAPSLSHNQVPVASLPDPVHGIADQAPSEGKTALQRNESAPDSYSAAVGKEPGDAKSDYLRKNFSYIQDIIQRNISYPVIARRRGWEGKVTVSFVICMDGRAKNIILQKTSGIGLLDKNAIETVERTSPFPRPPLEAKVVIPIVYKLY